MIITYRCLNQIVITGPKLRRRAGQARYSPAERIKISIDLEPRPAGLARDRLQAFAEFLADPGVDPVRSARIWSEGVASVGVHKRIRTRLASAQAAFPAGSVAPLRTRPWFLAS